MARQYKKVLTIQDISCVGQCSLTVALPILSACGHETAIIPSAVLSTHTTGFDGYTFADLTDEIPKIQEHWQRQGIRFNAIYTGYLGSMRQISFVKNIVETMGDENCIRIIDPAMADNGVLYPAFDEKFVEAMTELCKIGDLVLPNITEACMMTGCQYRESYDESYIEELLTALEAKDIHNIILTGVSYDESTTGIVVRKNGQSSYYRHEKMNRNCHGTGDVYASSFVGALLSGKTELEAAQIAGDYTLLCVKNTIDDPDHWYGVKFEPVLGKLIAMLEK